MVKAKLLGKMKRESYEQQESVPKDGDNGAEVGGVPKIEITGDDTGDSGTLSDSGDVNQAFEDLESVYEGEEYVEGE